MPGLFERGRRFASLTLAMARSRAMREAAERARSAPQAPPPVSQPKPLGFLERLEIDDLPRPAYAYGLYHATLQARGLGIQRISAVEFGVAGGVGLLALESLAQEVAQLVEVEIEVYGFDTGSGMPAALDYRDLPYVWEPGQFEMNVAALEARLERARLVLGDVRDTVPEHCRSLPAPVGFVSFDLDYYRSTIEAMSLFEQGTELLLPRVLCYLDDIIGDDFELHSEFAGELLAVAEFNAKHAERKIAPVNGLRWKRRHQAPWNEQIFALHAFDHPRYCDYVNPKLDWDARIRLPQG